MHTYLQSAASTINVNGTPQVFNNALLLLNGSNAIDIQGYIMGIRWTTGTQSEHVQTLNENAQPIAINPINSTPSGTITFAPGAFTTFYTFLNDRFTPFTLQFTYYTTGDLAGSTQDLLISGCKLDAVNGGVTPQSPANAGDFGFKATSINWL